jgi:hypothetical protein
MSFKTFSSTHGDSNKLKLVEESKAAPAAIQPATKADETLGKDAPSRKK